MMIVIDKVMSSEGGELEDDGSVKGRMNPLSW